MIGGVMNPAEIRYLCNASRSPVGSGEAEERFMLRGIAAKESRTGDGPPDRFKIANWGREEFRGGAVLTREDGVTEIRRRMAARRHDRVRIDVAHKTAFKSAADMNPEDILGYADLEAVPGDGLYLCNATWTDRALKIWKALPDPSPAFLARKKDSLMVELDSVGLCPDGELELPTLCSADASPPPPNTYLKSVSYEAMIQVLLSMLKKAGVTVPDKGEMTDTEYEAALTAAAAEYAGKEEKPSEREESPEMLSALDRRLKALEGSVNAQTAAAEKARKDEIVRLCSAEGKVIPLTDDQIYGRNGETAIALSALEAIYRNLQPTVPLKAGGARPAQGDKVVEVKRQLSADEQRINDMMGVTQEEVEKYASGQ
jgi:hypothetical protein